MGFRFSCDRSWFSKKLISKFLKTLYILVTLSMFQPSGRCIAVRVQNYYVAGNGFNSCSRHQFCFLFQIFSPVSLPFHHSIVDIRVHHRFLGAHMFVHERKASTCTVKIIPSKCTPLCQPCDVYFYRQVKIFIKKLKTC